MEELESDIIGTSKPYMRLIHKRLEWIQSLPQIFQFYFGGVNRVVREWLKEGCMETSQKITDKIVLLTLSFIRVYSIK